MSDGSVVHGSRLRASTAASRRGALMLPFDSRLMITTFVDASSGGSVATEAARIIEGKVNSNERKKFKKEHDMCIALARAGHKVEHRTGSERGRTFDVTVTVCPLT